MGGPYNWAALSPGEATPKAGTVFCRECGRPIEADAHFCRFCGKSQADPMAGSASAFPPPHTRPAGAGAARRPPAPTPPPAGAGLERWLQQLFPRHHLQDEFMHIGTIAAFLMA